MKFKIAVLTAAVSMIDSNVLWACSVCFGDPNDLAARGLNNAVLFMIGMVGCVLAAIAGIGWSWSRRAKKLAASQSSNA